MALAAIAPSTIDLNSQATFPIRLGASISKPADSKKFVSVRCNYVPKLEESEGVKSVIRPRAAEKVRDQLQLLLEDGGDLYRYYAKQGHDGKKDDRYVLLAYGSGNQREMVLERLSACHDFNLARLPDGQDALKMRQQYPRLPDDDLAYKDLLADAENTDDGPPDSGNPFDYRNYLDKPGQPKRSNVKPSPADAAAKESRPSSAPQIHSLKKPNDHTAAANKRKAHDSITSNPKRVKPGSEAPPSGASSNPKPDAPRIRMDRKASLHLPPFEDSGELVVDFETPVQEKPRSAMALALTGQLGQGPISLHSAAGSPSSRIASPAPPRPDYFSEGEGYELGESSPERAKQSTSNNRGAVNEDDEDADADVEDFELPSPTHTHTKRNVELPNPRDDHEGRDGIGDKNPPDDEDDLDKQLALAMAEGDDGVTAPAVLRPESEEESEEE